MTGNSWYTVARTSDKECVGRVTFSLGSSELVFDVLIQFGNYSLSIVSASVTTVFAIRIRSYGGFSYVDLRADETIEGSPSVTIQQYLNTLSLITFALAGSGKQECIVSTDSYTPVIEETYVTIDQVETITARKYFADGLAIGDRDNNYILTYGNDGVYMGNHRILTTVDGDTYVTTGSYNSTSKKIELKHGNTTVAEIDATAFIKDGMVDSVTVEDGYLVITFNTDAGKEPIYIPLSGFSDDFVTLTSEQKITGAKKHANVALLNIPMSAPLSGDMESGKSYLYVGTGAYAEEASGGGGGGGGETLTILRNGTQVATYNGSVPVSANILVPTTVASLSDASDYATKTWVENKGYITSAALSGYVTIATDQEITGAKYFSNALAIPLSAPSSPTSGLSYLYAGSGSYAEEPGGGVADVYPLTITKNGSSWLYYDPGEEAVSVNLSVPTKVSDLTNDTGFITSSALNGYATQTWVEGKGYITSSALSGYVNDFEVTGSGNAVTTGSKSGSKITLTKDNTFVDLTSEQKITGAKKHANVALLNIPTSISSSDIESGKVYLYSGSGEYAEEASGGVADVYPLYLVIGGTTTTYDPASESTTVTFGGAAKKGYTTSITQGSADLPTSDAVYSAIAAAVTSALHYRGMSSTALTDGGTETAIIGGVALVPQSGDVVIYGGFEFLWENNVWNKLGDDSSYALKTIQISAGTGLSGGGDLTSSRTISLSSATIASLGLADSALQSSDMKALTLKVGTTTIGSDYNALAAKTYTISKTNITDTIGSTTYAPYHADGYLPLSAGSGKALTGDLYFDSSSAAKYIKYKKSSTTMNAITMAKNGDIVIGSEDLQNITDSAISFCSNQIGFLWGPANDAEYLYLSGNYITTNAYLGSPNDRIYRAYLEKLDAATSIETAGTLSVGGVSTFTGKLLPSATNATDIGSSSKYFKDGYLHGWLYVTNIGHPNDTLGTMGTSSYRWSQIYATNTNSNIVRANDLLGIPTVAPQSGSVVSGEAYLYSSTGSYAETPGGGVADVYPLTITKNGSAWLSYNPGVQAESINLVVPTALSDLTADSAHRLVTDTEKAAWNAKYDKPSGGIPGTDLATAYLPLTGGTITSTGVKPLILNSTNSSSQSSLRLSISGTEKAVLGYQESYNVGAYLQNLAVTDYPYVNIASDGKFKYNNSWVFWHEGNDGASSGLDADLLDGEDGSYYNNFLTYYNGATPTANGITYPLALVQKGTPTGAWWYVTTMYYSAIGSNFYSQIATSYNATIPDMYIRQTYNGTATDWYKVYHAGNLTLSTLGGVPSTRKVNNKALSADITLSLDDVADGSTRKLADYLPLSGNSVATKITGNVVLGNNVFLQGVHTNGTDVRELIGLDNNNIVTVGCSTNQLRLITSSVDIKHNKNGTLYSVYDESNLTKSVLTGLLDANNGYYLPLTGGYISNSDNNNPLRIKTTLANTNGVYLPFYVNTTKKTEVGYWSGYGAYLANTAGTTQHTLKVKDDGTLGFDSETVWHSGNFTPGDYLPLTAGSSKALTGDLYLNASSAEKSIYMTDASNNAHQVATLTTAGNLTIGNNQPTLGGMTVIRGGTISLAVGDSTTNEKYNVNFFGSNGSFYPSPDNAVTWGDSSKKFKAMYAYTYYGTLDDLTYLTNHALNIDNAAVKGVNFHYANAGTKPTGSQDGSAFTLAWSSAWVTQMYGDWRTNKFYTRVKTNGTWGDWAELATTKGTVEGLNTSTESDATFTYRAVPSVAVGDVARVTKVKGKTIVWNQMITNPHFTDGSNWSVLGTLSISGNVARVTGNGTCTLYPTSSITTLANHIYYAWAYVRVSSSAATARISGPYVATEPTTNSTTFVKLTVIGSRTNDYVGNLPRIYTTGLPDANSYFEVKDFNVIDLTKMFGAGNEPSTVAEFEALYPEVFYSYNTGELVSNKAEALETIGFNLCDITALPSQTGLGSIDSEGAWYVPTPALGKTIWKNNCGYTGQIYIGFDVKYSGSSAGLRFKFDYTDGTSAVIYPTTIGTSYAAVSALSSSGKVVLDISTDYGSGSVQTWTKNLCINFSDSSKNGTYEPYRKDSLPLNITKLKVDTTNLWDEQWEQGTLDTNGADYASTINIRNKGYIPVEGGKTYYVKGNIQIYEYGASKNYITRTFLNSGTITLNVNTCYLRWRSADNYTYTEGDIWINTPTKRPPLKLNQMFENGDFSNGTTGWGYYNSSISAQNGALSVQVTQANGGFTTTSDKNPTLIGGHKYFIQYAFNSPSATSTFVYFNGNSFIAGKYVKAGYNVYAGIGTISTTATGPVIARFNATGTYTVYSIVLIDLTKMYGAGLEPTDTEIVSERIGLYRPYTTGEYMPYYAFPKGMRCADYACSVCDEVIGKQAIVKVGAVDLGLMSWTRDSSGIFYTGSVPGSVSRTSGTTHMILPKYNQKNASSSIGGASSNGDYCQAGARIAIYDTGYSDAVSFQRSLNSVKLYFELSTPIFYDLETAVPELIECDVLGTQRRLPEDTASSVQAPFHCDFQYGANPGEIVSDSSYRYLPLAGGTVTGTLEAKGELVIPDHAPYQPEPNKHYLYVNDNGNYYQS